MLGYLFVLALFACWFLVGFAALSALDVDLPFTRKVLLSPVVGSACVLLPVFWVNRLGVPVERCGPPIFVGAAAFALVYLAVRRPAWSMAKALPFAAIIGMALLSGARPFVHWGLDWVSFSNDDMANYTLAAQRFLHEGYFNIPGSRDFYSNANSELYSWQLYVLNGSRSGADLTLAVAASVFGIHPAFLFMPVIMSFYLLLLCGSSSLLASIEHRHVVTVIFCILMALSPLNLFGALYQLLGQVFGIAVLCSLITIIMMPHRKFKLASAFSHAFLAALLAATLAIVYPESTPFALLPWLFYQLLMVRNRGFYFKPFAATWSLALLLLILMLNTYIPALVVFLSTQTSGGLSVSNPAAVAFPFYLVPSGFAVAWGLLPIAAATAEPLLSIGIILGALLLVVCTASAIALAMRAEPIAIVAIVMLCLGAVFEFRYNDFGLYKLAMYAQPFILGTILLVWYEMNFSRRIAHER